MFWLRFDMYTYCRSLLRLLMGGFCMTLCSVVVMIWSYFGKCNYDIELSKVGFIHFWYNISLIYNIFIDFCFLFCSENFCPRMLFLILNKNFIQNRTVSVFYFFFNQDNFLTPRPAVLCQLTRTRAIFTHDVNVTAEESLERSHFPVQFTVSVTPSHAFLFV